VILADTSAWVEFLRRTGSPVDECIDQLLGEQGALCTTDVVVMEVLAGARDASHREQLRGLLAVCEFTPVEGLRDYEYAADLYRTCRAAGETIRALTDCLIAAVAIRTGNAILHTDSDFDALARHGPLQLA
jgi:predicted nucleic acid-binding protein